ncbi:MAG: corrinoid protein [Desulfofustis sp.]|jgi:5-methyltetrahydrofolate--homocysteine methyltransferase|nr:corrinoid protein [Desulfofustis sp.]
MSNHLEIIKEAIIGGKHKDVEELVRSALDDGVSANAIVNEAMIPGMDVVGKKFSNNEIFVPEMLVAAVTMNKGLDILKPILKQSGSKSKGTIVMCTVKGDLHDIGKNLVIMMLEGAGFDVIDVGVDTSVDKLIDAVKQIKPDVLGLSALLTTTLPEMAKVIQSLEANGMRGEVKVMIGGAPVDAAYSEKIGADGYGRDAAQAVEVARRLIV